MTGVDLLIKLALAAIVFFGVLNLAGLHTWVERKQSAIMQDRIGANRASIFGIRLFGLFHPLADAVKMFVKEDFIPAGANRFLHTLAPFLSVFFALAAFAGIPFGDRLMIGGRVIDLQVAKIDVALLYIFAMLSLGVYGVILAGYASRNNYAFLGALRASAQMISYEIALGISIVGVVMIFGTLDLQELVRAQGATLFGIIPKWGIVVQPVAFFIFLTAAMAETKRVPFDLPEGESEIIGYFVEYSGMKFGMFFLTDFVETVMVACLATTLFFGGWQIPYLLPDGFHFPWGAVLPVNPLAVVLLGIGSFSLKVLAFCWLFMTIRWTLPRFRYDQLMHLGWKILFPISIANVLVTGLVLALLHPGGW
ncbi:MAG: NADH-quinone oxidoreductase subunit H [Candidatus Omnitrophica bacterium]|nr:NADH-quinone oxidoreductase subunit H [Candidatus Omnitrophota bacterium]